MTDNIDPPLGSEEFRKKLMEALSKRLRATVPEIESPPRSKDDNAGKEAAALAAGELEAESARREHGRTERFRDNVAVAILIVFWIGFGAIVLAGALWGVNFLLPEPYHFLTDSQSERIFAFISGSGLTGFIGNYAKKRLT